MSIHVLSTTNLNFVGERNQRKQKEDKSEKKIVVFYSRHTSTENLEEVVNNRTKQTLFFLQAEKKNDVTLQCVPLSREWRRKSFLDKYQSTYLLRKILFINKKFAFSHLCFRAGKRNEPRDLRSEGG